MKPSLGKWFVTLFVIGAVTLMAAPYQWSATANKSEAYLHEAVELKYLCRFDNEGHLYTIDFKPPMETPDYSMQLLFEQERIESGRRINEYHYVLFPKQPGDMKLEFDLLMRKTTQDSIDNTVIGRDNVEDLDFTDTAMKTPAVAIDVKQHSESLAGRFAMEMEVDKSDVKAYEAVHVTLKVSGYGNFDELKQFAPKIKGVEQFSETPQRDLQLTSDGLKGAWLQRFALVGEDAYLLPSMELTYFDTVEKQVTTLKTPEHQIRVTQAYRAEDLLDDDVEEEREWQWKQEYLDYILIFLSGFVLGRWGRLPKRKIVIEKGFKADVKRAKNAKELAVLLVIKNDRRFERVIDALETETITLAEAKSEVIKLAKLTKD
jgi:hypothetical protein